jgi:hypothetical protein
MVSHWRMARDVSTTQDGTACCYLAQVSESRETSKWPRPVPCRGSRNFCAALVFIIFKIFVLLETVECLE